MGKLLVVCSGKGGVGKSTLAAGIGSAACFAGKRVLLIDIDAGLRCLDLLLGVSTSLVFDLSDVLSGKCKMKDAVLPVNDTNMFFLLAAPADPTNLNYKDLVSLAAAETRYYDYVIIDCSAGIYPSLYGALPKGSAAFVVATPDEISLRDAATTAKILSLNGIDLKFLIINRFNLKKIRKGFLLGIDSSIDKSGLRLVAVVPDDKKITISSLKGEPILTGRAFNAISRLIRRIDGENVPLPPLKKI